MTAYRLGMVTLLGILALGVFNLFGIGDAMNFNISFSNLNLIIGIALLSGVLGTTMYYRGIKNTPATSASLFELSFPLTGFLIVIFVMSKTPDVFQIVGGVAVIVVMAIIARR